MRVLAIVLSATLGFVVAGSATGQDFLALSLARDADRAAADLAARQREVALTNDLARLEAQAQINQAVASLVAQRAPVAVPAIRYAPGGSATVIEDSRFASIPDAVLADSRAKVRAAAQNRH